MMLLHFNFEKSLQAAGRLLSLEGGRMPSMRLLKLLYIADRESLAEVAAPITGDHASAMKNGPVLNHIHDLIEGESSRSEEWSRHIATEGYAVNLKHAPGLGKLSKGEVAKLNEVSERYRDKDQWEISDLTHDFPEWKQHFRESDASPADAEPIPWQDILKAQDKPEMIPAVEERETAMKALDDIFGAAS